DGIRDFHVTGVQTCALPISVGDVGESTLSDRLVLGEGGFISITVAVDETTGKTVSTPELSGRGFSDDPTALAEAAELVEAELLQIGRASCRERVETLGVRGA